MLSFAIPITLIYFIVRICLLKVFRITWVREVLNISFVLYISSLVFIVWLYYATQTDYVLYNLIPFKTIIEYVQEFPSSTAIKNIVGNLAICMPFGFYYYFNLRIIPKINIAVYAVIIPVIIESIQLLMYFINLGMRAVDIDDVILNCSGIIIAYYMTKSLFQKKRNPAKLRRTVGY
ncbi:VanZ family protein [Paenibacillus sp. sptzw28]|uniref:VanZ family protein n=1 Tax=Paenibacillus sp. sptzw28 TaxID=715179 RepID=UPI0037C95679